MVCKIDDQISDQGVILSYGESKGIVPMGTYVLYEFVNENGKRILAEEAIMKNGYAVLIEIEINHLEVSFKENSDYLIIPIYSYLDLMDKAPLNIDSFTKITNDDEVTTLGVKMVNDAMEGFLKDNQNTQELNILDFTGVSMKEANAGFICEGEYNKGTNYTLIPFEELQSFYLKKVRTKDDIHRIPRR